MREFNLKGVPLYLAALSLAVSSVAWAESCEQYCLDGTPLSAAQTNSNICKFEGIPYCTAQTPNDLLDRCSDTPEVDLCDSEGGGDDDDDSDDSNQAVLDGYSTLADGLAERCIESSSNQEENRIKAAGKKAASSLKLLRSMLSEGGVDAEEIAEVASALKHPCE